MEKLTSREVLFLDSTRIEYAKARFESEKAKVQNISREKIEQYFELLSTPRSYGARGYRLGFFVRPEQPDTLVLWGGVSTRTHIDDPSPSYFINLLGFDTSPYYVAWKNCGGLFLIGNEPENIRNERLAKELGKVTEFRPHNDDIYLYFKSGVQLDRIYLPQEIPEGTKKTLVNILLEYQLRIEHQSVLMSILDPTEETCRDRIQDCYIKSQNEREWLKNELFNAGWFMASGNVQVYDSRYREVNLETGTWNVHMVDNKYDKAR